MKVSYRRFQAMVALLFSLGTLAFAKEWETDFDKATVKASATGKYLLVNFSGSDWCGWCMKLDREVFSKKEFRTFAEEHLVLVMVDFPRNKPQTRREKERNQALAQKYGIKGYPTVLLLSPKGDVVGYTGYQPGGPEPFVEQLRQMIENHRSNAKANQTP